MAQRKDKNPGKARPSERPPEEPTASATEAELEGLDYYTLLGVEPAASNEDIRAAFRRFALRYHPDRFVDEPEALRTRATSIYRRGAEAVGVLSDLEQRKAYDAVLKRGEKRLKDDPTSLLRAMAQAAPVPTFVKPAPTPTVATFGKPSEANLRASRPKRQTKKSMRAMKPVPKAPGPPPLKIQSPQARAFFDRAQAARASGDLRAAYKMLKAAVDAEPGNDALERELFAVERQFRP